MYNRYRKNRPIDIVNTIFLIFIVTVYSFFMDDKYFNITVTRATVFTYSGIFYVLLMLMAMGLEIFLLKYYSPETDIFSIKLDSDAFFSRDARVYAMPELWSVLFLIANVFAFAMAPDKAGAWSGSTGRYMGLGFFLVLTLVFLFLSQQTDISIYVFAAFFCMAGAAIVIAIMQHFGMDPFALRARVNGNQKEMFISTFGNINTYGSYIAIILPAFSACFIFGRNKIFRAFAAVAVLLGSMAVIPAKSDNVYLGVGVAYIALFYVAVLNKKLTEYLFNALIFVTGLEILAVLNLLLKGSQKHINGIAQIVENPKIMLLFVIAVSVILVGSLMFRKLNYDVYKKIQCWKSLGIFSIIMGASLLLVILLGIRSGNELFRFDFNWGTYRGYIWTRCFNLFQKASPINKLFGYGNETISALMKENYYEEMVSVTQRSYDNAHNELLQYLVTTGVFGLITYLGFVFSTFIYIGKRMEDDAIAIACFAAAVGYAAQGLVNLNQPITTPFFFVALAAGTGYVRYKKQIKNHEQSKNLK